MAVRTSPKKAPQKQSLPAMIPVIAFVLLFVFVGWMGWHYVGPGSKPTNGALKGLDPKWMVQKAQESKGDIDKLSATDREQLVSRWGEPTARAMWQGEYQLVLQHQAMNRQPTPPAH